MNPLFELIQIAKLNSQLIDADERFEMRLSEFIIPIPTKAKFSAFEKHKGDVLYDTKELAGVAGMYNEINKENDVTVYANDLGSQIRGIDSVAKRGDVFLICEAKGTIRTNTNLSQYLRRTKTKGRQMSWDWIWSSLVDFAEDARNAKVFLELYKQVIKGEGVERFVYVTSLKKVKGKYAIINTKRYKELEIAVLKGMNDFGAQDKLQNWLGEIEEYR